MKAILLLLSFLSLTLAVNYIDHWTGVAYNVDLLNLYNNGWSFCASWRDQDSIDVDTLMALCGNKKYAGYGCYSGQNGQVFDIVGYGLSSAVFHHDTGEPLPESNGLQWYYDPYSSFGNCPLFLSVEYEQDLRLQDSQ